MRRESPEGASIVPPDSLTGVEPWDILVRIDCQENVSYIGLLGGREGGKSKQKIRVVFSNIKYSTKTDTKYYTSFSEDPQNTAVNHIHTAFVCSKLYMYVLVTFL